MPIRYRRNVDCLTADQLHDLREAYQHVYDLPPDAGESFATIAGIHGLPSPTWCDHGTPGFLTWHRAYMWVLEKALRCLNADIALPFWDWSSGPSTGVPVACAEPTYVNRSGDTVPNPLFRGPISPSAGGGLTTRRPDIDTTSFSGAATSAQTAMASDSYSSFQNAINGPHGAVHVTVGGHMASVPYAGFDPIFYLHHCNVDRLWWNWQRTHPGAPMPASERSHELDPFNKPFSTDWYVGSEMESTDDLGYRYANWCLILPPFRIWDVVTFRIDPFIARRLSGARLVIRSSEMSPHSVELRAFVNQPRATHRTRIVGNPSFAGLAGVFGMGDVKMESRSRSENFDLEVNVTGAIRDAVSEETDELKLKIVAVDPDGEPVEADRLRIDEVELVVD